MKKKAFRDFDIESRVKIIKALSASFHLWDYQTQNLLTVSNPVITLYTDGVCDFANVNDLHEFYFTSQSFTHENTNTKTIAD